jgi:Putative peptidoglycan binding domain
MRLAMFYNARLGGERRINYTMRKITGLLIAFSLALAGLAIAQQAEESPTKKGGRGEKTTQATETKPTRNAPGAETKPKREATEKATPETGGKQRGMKGERGTKSPTTTNAETSPAVGTNAAQEETGGKKGRQGRNATTGAAAETGASASPGATQAEQGLKGRQGRGANAATSATPTTRGAASATPATARAPATPATSVAPATSPATSAAAAATASAGTGAATTQQGTVGKGGKRVEPQQVQQIKQQHASFKAQPKPNVAPAVTFNANFRIGGAERWQGPQYEVFRSYHPEWHDQVWYRSHFTRVELIAGGWYYWNNGYWYPAWGYNPGAAYYAYDGPIYVGHRAEPPDQVIADVQAELKDMGYYTGEVDGLLGPLTREALRDYQADHGLMVTEAIDEPTLDALQLS